MSQSLDFCHGKLLLPACYKLVVFYLLSITRFLLMLSTFYLNIKCHKWEIVNWGRPFMIGQIIPLPLEPEGRTIFHFWFSLNLIYFVLQVLRNMHLSSLISGCKKKQFTGQYHSLCNRHDFISQIILTSKETHTTVNLVISEELPHYWVWRWVFHTDRDNLRQSCI